MQPVSLYGQALLSGNEFVTMEKRQLREGRLLSTTFQSFLTGLVANYSTLVFSIQIQRSKQWVVDVCLHNSTTVFQTSRITSALNRLLCDWFNLPRKEFAIARLTPGVLTSLTVSTQCAPKPTVQVKCLLKDSPGQFRASKEICQCRPFLRNLGEHYQDKNVLVHTFSCLLGTWFILECCNTILDRLQFTLYAWEIVKMENHILISEQFLNIDHGTLLRRNKITSLYAFPILSSHTIIDVEQVRDDLHRFYNEKYYYHEELIILRLEFHPDDMEAIQDRVMFFFFEGRPTEASIF